MARKNIGTPTVLPEVETATPEETSLPPDEGFPSLEKETNVHPEPSPGMRRIVMHLFDSSEDIWEMYKRLQKALTVGERRTDYATLMQALDEAEDNWRSAHRLYCVARLEQERVDMDASVLEAAARREALRQLEAEKESGQRKKQITEADIEGRMLEVFPEDVRRLKELKLKVRKTVEHTQELTSMWASRARSLQTMVGKLR